MLRISTKGRYSLRLMLELCYQYGEGPVMLKKIAKSQDISERYLGQIVIPLRTAGLLRAERGARGGYMLAKPPAKITVKEIVKAVEGELSLVDCVKAPKVCDKSNSCVARTVWTTAAKKVENYLDSLTLVDVMKMDKSSKKQRNKECV